MKIHFITIGTKMPSWVEQGYKEYAQRLTGECQLKAVEIQMEKRGKNPDINRLKQKEGEKILAAIPKGALVVALEVTGKHWTTEELATNLESWMHGGRDVALIVGGPDGLSQECLQRADVKWSLSKLTFPHPLVRVVVAEQIYRAYTVTKNHPYHRS